MLYSVSVAVVSNWVVIDSLPNLSHSAIKVKTNKMVCTPSKDLDQPAHPHCDQSLCCALNMKPRTQGFLMRTAKTDQTLRMPRLIWVFAGHTGHFVGFVVLWLNLVSKSNLQQKMFVLTKRTELSSGHIPHYTLYII